MGKEKMNKKDGFKTKLAGWKIAVIAISCVLVVAAVVVPVVMVTLPKEIPAELMNFYNDVLEKEASNETGNETGNDDEPHEKTVLDNVNFLESKQYTLHDVDNAESTFLDTDSTIFRLTQIEGGYEISGFENDEDNSKYKTIAIPKTITRAEQEYSIKGVNIQNKLNNYSMTNLESIVLQSNVESINTARILPLSTSQPLRNILVTAESPYYTDSKGVLIKKNEGIANELVCYAKARVSTTFEIPTTVTTIGNDAFYGCSALESVIFGENSSLQTIGDYAFQLCNAITSISIPNSVTSIGTMAYSGCNMLRTVTFEDDSVLQTIGSNAFERCSALETVTFAANSALTSIGHYAFSSCSALTSITIPSMVTSIGDSAFYGCRGLTSITIPNTVTTIDYEAFYGCSALETVTFEENSALTSIGSNAFRGCISLASIFIPSKVVTIPDGESMGAFFYCSGLESITVDVNNTTYYSEGNCLIQKSNKKLILGCKNSVIPNDVEKFGDYAFVGCSALKSITIPSSVTSAKGEATFTGCSGLETITVDAGNTKYYSAGNCLILKSNNTLILACKNSVIPSSVTSISGGAFENCSGLTSITIPSSVTSIYYSAFRGCSALESITVDAGNVTYYSEGNCLIQKSNNTLIFGCKNSVIPNDITSIGKYAFYGCSGLTSITIPSAVTSIGDSAFYLCSALTSITIPSSVTSIGSYAFLSCNFLVTATWLGDFSNTRGGLLLSAFSGKTLTIKVPASELDEWNSWKAGNSGASSFTFEAIV